MEGMLCTSPVTSLRSRASNGDIVFPTSGDEGEQYPLVSYAPDTGDRNHSLAQMKRIAVQGYVVVAPRLEKEGCADQHKDQLHAIEWAIKTPILRKIVGMEVGYVRVLVGWKMGGLATLKAVSEADQVQKLNIKVAIAQHPPLSEFPCKIDPQACVMFTTSDHDVNATPQDVRKAYDGVDVKKAWFKAFVSYKDAEDDAYLSDFINCDAHQSSYHCQQMEQCREHAAATDVCVSARPSRPSPGASAAMVV